MKLSLRPSSQKDLLWLDPFYESLMKPYVELTHTWDHSAFRENFDTHSTSIITVESEDIGMLKVKHRHDHIYLADILIKPDFQGRGYGTQLVANLLTEAKLRNVPLKLRVLKANPARALYSRLGFRTESEDAHAAFLTTFA